MINDEIIQQFGRLDAAQGRKVLDFARRLSVALGTPCRELLNFAGAIDDRDLAAISEAIQEGCEINRRLPPQIPSQETII